jgi:hypothetical protein
MAAHLFLLGVEFETFFQCWEDWRELWLLGLSYTHMFLYEIIHLSKYAGIKEITM